MTPAPGAGARGKVDDPKERGGGHAQSHPTTSRLTEWPQSRQERNFPPEVSTVRVIPHMGQADMRLLREPYRVLPPHEVTMRPLAIPTMTALSSVMASPKAMVLNWVLRLFFVSADSSSKAPVMCWMP